VVSVREPDKAGEGRTVSELTLSLYDVLVGQERLNFGLGGSYLKDSVRSFSMVFSLEERRSEEGRAPGDRSTT